jgi:two-component system sensor histidine kinase QseC
MTGAIAGVVLAGWPVMLALGTGAAGVRMGTLRRRAALNRGLHELRRPLQALALAPEAGAPGALDLALAALDGLDSEINGAAPTPRRRTVDSRELVSQAVARGRPAASAGGRGLELEWLAGPAPVLGDAAALAGALDNLIANALEHGGGQVRVEGRRTAGAVRIVVADDGRLDGPESHGRRDPRRGHGLGIVARVAADHGGRFVLGRFVDGTAAALELPLA